MHEFWRISTYTRSQNNTTLVVDENGIQTFEVVVVVLLFLLFPFDVFVLTSAHLLLFLKKWFVQIHLNVSSRGNIGTQQ